MCRIKCAIEHLSKSSLVDIICEMSQINQKGWSIILDFGLISKTNPINQKGGSIVLDFGEAPVGVMTQGLEKCLNVSTG